MENNQVIFRKGETVAQIYIPNPIQEEEEQKEQYIAFQKDGQTISVPYDIQVDVPLWLAERAKEIGLVKKYKTYIQK